MCMACEEMQLFYAYLDAVEEAKRKAQPWECEVTIIPQNDDEQDEGPRKEQGNEQGEGAPVIARTSSTSMSAKPGFSCDETE